MLDTLYLNLWYADSDVAEIVAHAVAIMRQFPFSSLVPGITNVAIHPISWSEATIFEQRFRPGVSTEEAIVIAAGFLHEDYAYVIEANWDLWTPQVPEGEWTLQPSLVKFVMRGADFENAEWETQGQIQVDFGPDTPFLYEELQLSRELESRVRSNVKKLVDFTTHVEKNSGASTRLLWSESEESLAQKLVSRLQRIQ